MYLVRVAVAVFIEGVFWTAFGLGFRGRYGLHPLWMWPVCLWCAAFAVRRWYDRKRWQDVVKSATLSVGVLWMYFFVVAAYIAVATAEDLDPAAEILITGIAYPALAVGLKVLMLGAVAKQESKSLGQGENALYEDGARGTEIALTLPCVIAILRIDSTLAFVAASALSFGCEISGILFTMLRHTPRAYKTGSRKMGALVQQASLRGNKIGTFKNKSSNALMDDLTQKKRRFAIKIANEEWAERLVVATAAPIVLIIAPHFTAQTLALRTLGLIVAEAGVDAIKTAICHRFGVLVGRVEVRLGVWSAGVCVAQYICISWILSVGVMLYKYV